MRKILHWDAMNDGADGSPLGNIGKYASPASQCGGTNNKNKPRILLHGKYASPKGVEYVPTKQGKEYELRLVQRFAMQSAARELLPREAVHDCMRSAIPGQEMGVSVLYAPVGGTAHYGGLRICKSVWHCPVCAAKITERRKEELSEAIKKWGGAVLLATYTLQHDITEPLSEVLAALQQARRWSVSGKAAKAMNERYGIAGMVRSLELTHGENGWHPHMHCLLFLEGTEPPIIPLELDLKERWGNSVAKTGRYASWAHGCDVRYTDADIASYVAKFGREPKWTAAHEVTKSITKKARAGGRTPMQLLADFLAGDKAAGRRWLEYACNMKGERQLVWSHGLRAKLGIDEEKTDEEIAVEQEEVAVLLASLSVGAWRAVLANDARAELLAVAATGDEEQVRRFLNRLGIKA